MPWQTNFSILNVPCEKSWNIWCKFFWRAWMLKLRLGWPWLLLRALTWSLLTPIKIEMVPPSYIICNVVWVVLVLAILAHIINLFWWPGIRNNKRVAWTCLWPPTLNTHHWSLRRWLPCIQSLCNYLNLCCQSGNRIHFIDTNRLDQYVPLKIPLVPIVCHLLN